MTNEFEAGDVDFPPPPTERAALRSPGKRTPEHALFYICRKLHLRLGIEMVSR